MEMFAAFDDDGSDSLEKGEFAQGLREAGFFDQKGLPVNLGNEAKVIDNLYPLLDSSGTGVVQPDQLLFLEKNTEKRAEWDRILMRKRDGQFGAFAKDEDANEAHGFLKDTGFKTTRLGKQHWKMMPYTPLLGGVPPEEAGPQPLFAPGPKSNSSPDLNWKGPKKQVPRFLREFREAKRQGKLIGKAAREAREQLQCQSSPDLRPNTAPPFGANVLGQLPKVADAELAVGAPPCAAPSFGLAPAVVGSATLRRKRRSLPVCWAKNSAAAEKVKDQRKAYCGSFVAASPKRGDPFLGEACKLPTGSPVRATTADGRDLRPLGQMQFSPGKSFDFITSSKAMSLWDYYDIAHIRS